MPSPVLWELVRHTLVYSRGELEILAEELGNMEEESRYLTAGQSHVTQMIHQRMHAYRMRYI